MPRLSVIIPAYNSAATIERCLKAVRESTYQDYEIILVDDGSRDATGLIAEKIADRVIFLSKNKGRTYARNIGMQAARGDIFVNIDSDILIEADTLAKVNDYFSHYQEIDAVTGILSKKYPHKNFFSQYKNFYMYYNFSLLPERITFLYGSIYAIRRKSSHFYDHSNLENGEDTELGQNLLNDGKQIVFLRTLEVVHLKEYTLKSFIKNDFRIPFGWSQIFLRYKGWKQLYRNETGYAHSPKGQLLSIMIAPLIFLLAGAAFIAPSFMPLLASFIFAWLLLNLRFFIFLNREKGLPFTLSSIPITFTDNLIMISGIISGVLSFLVSKLAGNAKK